MYNNINLHLYQEIPMPCLSPYPHIICPFLLCLRSWLFLAICVLTLQSLIIINKHLFWQWIHCLIAFIENFPMISRSFNSTCFDFKDLGFYYIVPTTKQGFFLQFFEGSWTKNMILKKGHEYTKKYSKKKIYL